MGAPLSDLRCFDEHLCNLGELPSHLTVCVEHKGADLLFGVGVVALETQRCYILSKIKFSF